MVQLIICMALAPELSTATALIYIELNCKRYNSLYLISQFKSVKSTTKMTYQV
jgi:hypothetical protein